MIIHYYDLFDQYFVSGAQWDYSPDWNPVAQDGWNHEDLSIVNAQGMLRDNFIPRPYPAMVAGTPGTLNVSLNGSKGLTSKVGDLTFAWENNPQMGGTEFVLPSALYGVKA